jgi:hypothetical protein
VPTSVLPTTTTKKQIKSWKELCMTVIPALRGGKGRQESHEFKPSLGTITRPMSNNQKINE